MHTKCLPTATSTAEHFRKSAPAKDSDQSNGKREQDERYTKYNQEGKVMAPHPLKTPQILATGRSLKNEQKIKMDNCDLKTKN